MWGANFELGGRRGKVQFLSFLVIFAFLRPFLSLFDPKAQIYFEEYDLKTLHKSRSHIYAQLKQVSRGYNTSQIRFYHFWLFSLQASYEAGFA